MKVKTKDEVVRRVIRKIDERSLIGQEKYGDTMMSEVNSGKKDLARFMVDVQEELTDMLLYLEAARECLQQEIEECYLRDIEVVDTEELAAQYNDGEECEGDLGSHPLCSTDYCPCKEDIINDRMDIIGQNGNTGEHYNPWSGGWTTNTTSNGPITKYP